MQSELIIYLFIYLLLVLDDSDYNEIVTAICCIDSLTHLHLHCNRLCGIITTLRQAAEKAFLQNIEELKIESM